MGILADFRRAMAKADAFSRNLARGYAQRSNLLGKLVDSEPFSPHINPFDMEILHAAVKDFILRLFAQPLPDNTTWGFKEVRYFADDLEFFAALFPAARFIVLVREPVEQMSSYVRAPWRQKPDLGNEDGIEQLRQSAANAARGWTRQYESLRQFASRHKDASMVVRFDELIDGSTLVKLFAHIGLAPPDDEGTRSVLARTTGSSDKSTMWTAEDRAVLDDIIAGTAFPPEHDDVLSFYFGDRAAASRTVSPPPSPVPA